MSLQQRWQLAFECALVLFACSAGPGAFLVWRHGAETYGAYWMVVGVPASAAFALVAVSVCVPGLFAVGNLKFPLQITMPLIYTGLLVLSAAMWMTTPEELVTNPDVMRFAGLWQQPFALVLAGGMEIVGLTLLGLLRQM